EVVMPARTHAYRRRRSSNPLGVAIGLSLLAIVVVVSLMIISKNRRSEPEAAPAETPAETARVDPDRETAAMLEEIRNGNAPPHEKILQVETLILRASTDQFKKHARMVIDSLKAEIAAAVAKDVEAVRSDVMRLIDAKSFATANERIRGLEAKHGIDRADLPALAKLSASIDAAWDAWAEGVFEKYEALIAQGEDLKARGLLAEIDTFGKPEHKGKANYLRRELRRPEEPSPDPTIPPAIAEAPQPEEEPAKPFVAPREEPEPVVPAPAPEKEPAPAEAEGGEPFEAFVIVGDRDRQTGLQQVSVKTGLRRGSGLLEIPSGVPVYVDAEVPEKSLREALQPNQKIQILGRLREDTGPTKGGWGGETRRIFNIVLVAMGESVDPNRRYRYAKDPGVSWFEGTVQDVGPGMPIRMVVDGRTYDFSGMPAHTVRRTQVGPQAIQPRVGLHIRGEWRGEGSDGRITPKRIIVVAPSMANYEPYLSFVQDGGTSAPPAK
ncbi:MAG: hypothetical protein JXP34_24145, partial [Planctomycetes bacterium]|nr:hypothetical protein [Planctomycetota bacterium]